MATQSISMSRTGSMQHAAEACSCHLLATKVFAEGFIETGEIRHISQNDTHIDDILRCHARGLKHAHQIIEGLPRLRFNIPRDDGAGDRIERPCARYEKHIAEIESLAQAARRSGRA